MRGLRSLGGRLPVGVVMLHHPEPTSQLDPAGKASREHTQRLPVRVADEDAALLAAPLTLAGEVQPCPVIEVDSLEAVEFHRPGLGGLAIDPDGPLRAFGRIVDAAHEIPAHRTAVRRPPDPGRPVPDRVVGVIAGRLVLDASRLHLETPGPEADVTVHPHVDSLSGPDVLALLGRTNHLDPAAAPESKEPAHLSDVRMLRLDPDDRSLIGRVHDQPLAVAALGPHVAAGAGHQETGPLPKLLLAPVPDRPERLPDWAHVDPRRAQQEVVAVSAHVAPALTPVSIPAQRQIVGGKRQLGARGPGTAPGKRRITQFARWCRPRRPSRLP